MTDRSAIGLLAEFDINRPSEPLATTPPRLFSTNRMVSHYYFSLFSYGPFSLFKQLKITKGQNEL